MCQIIILMGVYCLLWQNSQKWHSGPSTKWKISACADRTESVYCKQKDPQCLIPLSFGLRLVSQPQTLMLLWTNAWKSHMHRWCFFFPSEPIIQPVKQSKPPEKTWSFSSVLHKHCSYAYQELSKPLNHVRICRNVRFLCFLWKTRAEEHHEGFTQQ